jgi:hypothetical protein
MALITGWHLTQRKAFPPCRLERARDGDGEHALYLEAIADYNAIIRRRAA